MLAVLAVAGIGLFGMGMAPSMQHRVVSLAGAGGPLAASLPASAVNVGIALGSVAGGVAIDASGLQAAVLTGAAIAAAAVGAAWLTGALRPEPTSAAEPATHPRPSRNTPISPSRAGNRGSTRPTPTAPSPPTDQRNSTTNPRKERS